jgi:hypothetical protein
MVGIVDDSNLEAVCRFWPSDLERQLT